LGIALELWDQDWIANWKREYAEQYINDKNKKVWRKKTGKPQKPAPKPAPAPTTPTDDHQAGGNAPESEKLTNTPSEVPEGSGVALAQELAETYTGNQILGSKNGELVKSIVDLSGKTTVEVCKFVGTLEKSKKFAIGEVVKALQGEQGETA
jgi:hypothetical protein